MSNGNIYFLGENPGFRILTDRIFARNERSSAILIIPFRIEFIGFGRRAKSFKAEVLFSKAELRAINSSIKCSESIMLANHQLSANQLSYESQFDFTINYETIAKIEKERKGDLTFSVAVAIEAAVYDEIIFEGNLNKQFVSEFSKGSGYIDFLVPQSSWVNTLLPQMGHDSFRLFELPKNSHIIPEAYSKSLNELEEAKRYFLNGDYDKAVGHCRSALDPFKAKKDELKTFIKSKSELSWINEVLVATDEWLLKLVKSTSHFTSKAHHIPSVGHFGRSEAEIIMMITTALIAYIAKVEGVAPH